MFSTFSKKGKSGSHPLNEKMKKLLDAFGMEWRTVIINFSVSLIYYYDGA